MPLHRNASGPTRLHMPFIAQGSDPGAIGAHKAWLDTGTGTVWIRNAGNDGWVYLAGSQPVDYEETVARTLAKGDHGYRIRLDHETGVTLTIPANATDDLPIGFRVEIEQVEAGAIALDPEGGVTLLSLDAADETAGPGAVALLLKAAENLWVASGDLIPPES